MLLLDFLYLSYIRCLIFSWKFNIRFSFLSLILINVIDITRLYSNSIKYFFFLNSFIIIQLFQLFNLFFLFFLNCFIFNKFILFCYLFFIMIIFKVLLNYLIPFIIRYIQCFCGIFINNYIIIYWISMKNNRSVFLSSI